MRNRWDLKKKMNLNYRQNMLPINLDNNKYWTHECCRAYIRSELKFTPHEKMQYVCSLCRQFYRWKWIAALKKISWGRRRGILSPSWGCYSHYFPYACWWSPFANPYSAWSLAWDHFCGVIANHCGVITNPCGEPRFESADADANRCATH